MCVQYVIMWTHVCSMITRVEWLIDWLWIMESAYWEERLYYYAILLLLFIIYCIFLFILRIHCSTVMLWMSFIYSMSSITCIHHTFSSGRCDGSKAALQTTQAVVPGSNTASFTRENSWEWKSHCVCCKIRKERKTSPPSQNKLLWKKKSTMCWSIFILVYGGSGYLHTSLSPIHSAHLLLIAGIF